MQPSPACRLSVRAHNTTASFKGHCKHCCFLSGTAQILVNLMTEACTRRSATDEVARILACHRNYYSVLKVRCLGSLWAHQASSCCHNLTGLCMHPDSTCTTRSICEINIFMCR